MNQYYKIGISTIVCLSFVMAAVYVIMFYPRQSMPVGEPISVMTIDTAKYHNDCLHPCIRYDVENDIYIMAQSPYYGENNQVENPMLYKSDDYKVWEKGLLMTDTQETGYNSDPNICLTKAGDLIYLWRECGTPLCDSLGCYYATVGGIINDGKLKQKQVYVINRWEYGDTEQCPILLEHDGSYYIYAAWYQYVPERKDKGIAIWKGESIKHLDFILQDTISFNSVYTVDKLVNIPLFGHIFYLSKPLYHDLWHFDLFEYGDKLYMISVAEKGDNIMLSVSEDWTHFRTFRKPLVNNHYTENYCGYRQYYYKPSAFIKNDTLHLFYTANAKDDPNRNQLYHTSTPVKRLMK